MEDAPSFLLLGHGFKSSMDTAKLYIMKLRLVRKLFNGVEQMIYQILKEKEHRKIFWRVSILEYVVYGYARIEYSS